MEQGVFMTLMNVNCAAVVRELRKLKTDRYYALLLFFVLIICL